MKQLKPQADVAGRLKVRCYTGSKQVNRKVASLVMLAFVGERPEGMDIRHLDGVVTNNNLSNLCYGTRSENILDCVRHGTHPRKKYL